MDCRRQAVSPGAGWFGRLPEADRCSRRIDSLTTQLLPGVPGEFLSMEMLASPRVTKCSAAGSTGRRRQSEDQYITRLPRWKLGYAEKQLSYSGDKSEKHFCSIKGLIGQSCSPWSLEGGGTCKVVFAVDRLGGRSRLQTMAQNDSAGNVIRVEGRNNSGCLQARVRLVSISPWRRSKESLAAV